MLQQRRDVRQVSGCCLQNLAAFSSWCAVQRCSGTQLAIAPALIRTEEERAIRAADVGWATFAKARQVQWATDSSADLVFNAERCVLSTRVGGVRIAEAGALVSVAARVEGIAVVEPEK